MARRVIQIILDMANAIREKSGDTEKIVGKDIPEKIRNLATRPPYDSGIYYNEFYGIEGKNSDGLPKEITFFGDYPEFNHLTVSSSIGAYVDTVNFIDVDSIKQNILSSQTKLTTININSDISSICKSAFSGCNALTTINFNGLINTIPSTVTEIPIACFMNCSSLREGDVVGITLHDDITSIGTSAFQKCTITNNKLPENLRLLDSKAFYNADIKITEIPESVEEISMDVFYNNGFITELTFKGTPTKIHNSAFEKMNNLVTINVPWSEGAVTNAPWGATNATINYNYVG